MTPPRRLVAATFAAVSLVGCATTIDDADVVTPSTRPADEDIPASARPALDDDEPIDGGDIDASVPVATTPIAGDVADLLPEMAAEMSRLSGVIAEGGDDDETLARIAKIWDTIRLDVATTRPELVEGIDATIDMAKLAVDRTRPADADKGFSILTDLVDNYFGE